ncbi:MAG: CotH kinase family protein [Bacteroidaceae bacterium]
MTIHSPHADPVVYAGMNLRGRGNSTWGYPKKPYAIKLGKKAEVLGMPAHKRWVLLANWGDRTLLRNDAAFRLSSGSLMDWTPRGTHVEVVFNGAHVGNYYLCEQIKVDPNRVAIQSMTAADTTETTITGGYLMELDTNYDEVNKFQSSLFKLPYMFKEPDEEVLTTQQFDYMQNHVAQLESILRTGTKLHQHEYEALIDVPSFIEWWLIHEATVNGEAYWPKSVYMHKDRDGKLKAGPVWDFDYATFRNDTKYFYIKNRLYYLYLFLDAQFIAQIKERWPAFRAVADELPAYVRSQKERLAASDVMNHALWPINADINHDEQLTFDEAVETLISNFEARIAWMEGKIDTM